MACTVPRREVRAVSGMLLLAIVPAMMFRVLLPLKVIHDFVGSDRRGDDAWANAFMQRLTLYANVTAACFVCLLCEVSDRVGRRPVLAVVTLFGACDAVACGLATTAPAFIVAHTCFNAVSNPWVLLALSFASVADIVEEGQTPEQIAVDFAFTEAVVFFSVVCVPFATGEVAQRLGFRAAFFVAALFSLAAALYILTSKETLVVDRRHRPTTPTLGTLDDLEPPLLGSEEEEEGGASGEEPFSPEGGLGLEEKACCCYSSSSSSSSLPDWVRFTPVAALAYFLRDRRHVAIGGLCFLVWLGMRGLEYLFPFVADALFGWSTSAQGAYMSIQGSFAVFAAVALAPLGARLVRNCDLRTVALFTVPAILGSAMAAVATRSRPRLFLAGLCLYALQAPANPALRAAVVHSRGTTRGRAAALGAAALLETLAQFTSALFGPAFHADEATSVFLGTTACFLGAFVAALALAATAPAQMHKDPPHRRHEASPSSSFSSGRR